VFLRRWAPPGIAAAASVAWALSPYLLGSMASGQTCKAQIWVLPAVLAAFGAVLDARGRAILGHAALLAFATVACAFTEASYALLLPFALGAYALFDVLAGPDRVRRAGLGLLGLAVTAVSLLPAQTYYNPLTTNVAAQAFHPAQRPSEDAIRIGAVMTWESAIRGVVETPHEAWTSVHVTYLTLPLLIAGIGLGILGRGGRLGLALAAVGGVLGAGEVLIRGGAIVRDHGLVMALPDAWLARYGYPLAKSGMYYRAATLAGLGLSLGVAAGAARIGGRRGLALAWIIGALAVGDGLRATRTLWPRPVQRIPGLTAYQEMAADPVEGAVLDLPISETGYVGQTEVRAAAVHGRKTTGLPRGVRRNETAVARLIRDLDGALASPSPGEALHGLGYRYVVYHGFPAEMGPTREALVTALGPPRKDGDVWVWTVGG
jgi:hypothetical protein